MRHRKAGRKFGRNSGSRLAMFRNQVTSLLEHERIETTVPRAKEVRGIAERLITLGKRGGLHSVRLVERVVRKKSVITKLFNELAPRFRERPGGYTRIVRTRRRLGDGAPMGFLELLPPPGGRLPKGAARPAGDEKPAATEKPAAEKPAATEKPAAEKEAAAKPAKKPARKKPAEKPADGKKTAQAKASGEGKGQAKKAAPQAKSEGKASGAGKAKPGGKKPRAKGKGSDER